MRKGLVLVLAVLMLIAFTATAYAAQVLVPTTDKDVYGPGSYIPTPTSKTVYGYNNSPAKFNPDGTTYYPNEIYLPNEQNPASYRIHSNYSKNTDACAACHATHTAVGESLLQWGTVYDTCMACHDGTIGTTYNVEEGYIANTTTRTFGGMFGVGNEKSLSRHNVVGSLQIFAAPGGNSTGNYEDVVNIGHDSNPKMWDIEFGCESCHSPHGQGGNARILSADPNKIARANYVSGLVYGETFKEGFSKKKVELAYFGNTTTPYFVAYENGITAGNEVTFLKGYPYSTEVWVNGTKATNFTVDNTAGYTRLFVPGVDPASATVKVYFFPGVRVKMNITNYLQGNEGVAHISGLNYYCGACHTDYNTNLNYNDGSVVATGSGHTLNGKYTEAYRHQVGFYAGYFTDLGKANMKLESSKMSCLTCHYAHGASVELWKDTLDKTFYEFDDSNYQDKLLELAGSSALKRAPNMGTCENCHDQKTGNEGYAANAGASNEVTPAANITDGTSQANAKFVGSAKCVECHASYAEGFKETYHNNMATYYNIDKNTAVTERAYKGSDALLSVFMENPDLKTTSPYSDIWNKINGQTSTFDVVLWGKPDEAAYVAVWDGSAYQRKAELEYNEATGKYELVYKSGTLTCINCHSVNNYSFETANPLTTDVNQQITNVGLPYITPPAGVTAFIYNAGGTAKASLRTLITNGGVATASDGTGVVELQINCEACHGPGSAHVAAPSSKNITGWKQYNYGVRVGLPYQTKSGSLTGISLPTKAQSCGSCHNSNTHQGFYYKSKHFVNGQMDCMVCHDPHSDKYEWQLKLPVKSLCMSCHDYGMASGNVPVFTKEDSEKFIGTYSTSYHLFDDMGTTNEGTFAATNNLLP